jgi:hypothetical protein
VIKNYRICVDGQYYTGEKECSLDTWTSSPWSANAFQTKRVDRNILTFEPKENNNFKVITGIINLIGEIKKIIQFISMTGLLAGNEITIETEPYKIPLELNIDYYLGLESELSRQKAICDEMKNQLDIATDLGQKRFEELEKARKENNDLSHDKESLMAYYMGNSDMKLVVADLLERRETHALRAQLAEAQAEVDRLTVQLEEAGKALSGLGYTPSADDSGSYDSLIPDKYL